MAWDFTADSDIQRSMAQKIKEKSESLDGEFANLYGEIGNLGTHWVGEDYNLFSSGCDGYKTALADMTTSMKMYAGHFEKIATGTDELATTLIGIVQNMTTRGGGGPVAGPNAQTPNQSNPNQTNPDQSNPGQTGDGDRNIGGGSFGDDTTGDGDRNIGGGSFGDDTTGDDGQKVKDGDTKDKAGDDDKAETYTSVTLNSGDVVKVNGQNMRFYGAYSDPRGTSVNMYADNQGNLFYEDGSPVQLSRVAGNGQTVYTNANINTIGTSVQDNAHGYNFNSSWNLLDANGNFVNENKIASSVIYENGEQAPALTNNENMGALVDNTNSITQGATLKDSYVNAVTGDVINGHNVAVPSSMQGLSSFVANGTDVIRIDPQYKVQWDPSSGWGNGYDFDTSRGPVYLIKSNDGTYYNLCDEYGNIINDKHFTPDGFNVEHGQWK